jgi:4-carboxymuconolactone decarboxylase
MPRLQPLAPPYEPEIARTLDRMMPPGMPPLNLFRTVAHNRHVLDKLRSTGAYLLNFGTLEDSEREFVIQYVCERCGCDYERDVHAAFFGRPERDELLARTVDELHDTGTLSDATWTALAERYRPEQLVELVALCGQYHVVSYLANAFEVEPERTGSAAGT